MAIDTAEKRRSVAGLVTPNILKNNEWRRQVAGLYSGIVPIIVDLSKLPSVLVQGINNVVSVALDLLGVGVAIESDVNVSLQTEDISIRDL